MAQIDQIDQIETSAAREMTSRELIQRTIADLEDPATWAGGSAETLIRDLTMAIERLPAADPVGVVFDRCPACDRTVCARLMDGWQGDEMPIAIVGCGNPWHYATRSLGDSPESVAQGDAVMPSEVIAQLPGGESAVVQVVDPAPGQNRVVVHRNERELGHTPDAREFTSSICRRCGLMIAYAVRDQVVCGGLAGKV